MIYRQIHKKQKLRCPLQGVFFISGGTGKAYYTFTKKNNIKPFLSRKEYIAFDKIQSFEVKDYND
jgi:hypothetical protein